MKNKKVFIILFMILIFLLAGGICTSSFLREKKGKEYVVGYSSLLAGMAFQQIGLREGSFMDRSENEYILEYSHLQCPEWKNGKFYAVNPLVSWKTTTYPKVISGESVENLVGTLDIKKENLLYKGAKDLKDLAEQPGFLLYEENTDETVLLITNKGDLYYKGYYYTGNTDAFIEAFPLFMEQSVECENSLDKEEFSEYWNEIQWNE